MVVVEEKKSRHRSRSRDRKRGASRSKSRERKKASFRLVQRLLNLFLKILLILDELRPVLRILSDPDLSTGSGPFYRIRTFLQLSDPEFSPPVSDLISTLTIFNFFKMVSSKIFLAKNFQGFKNAFLAF
jgi:hypothetical protein